MLMKTEAFGPLPTLRQVLARVHLRLTLFAIVMAGATLTITGVLVIRGYADRNLALIAQTVSYTVEPALVFDDIDAVREGIVMVASSEGVNMVEVRDNDDRLIAEWQRPGAGLMVALEKTAGRLLWPDPSVAVVRHGNEAIAEVRVFGDAGGIGRYVMSGILTALACLGLTAVATHLLARRLQKDVTTPLAQIASAAHAVRADRSFDRRAPRADISEIDELGQDFNALMDELQSWHAGITSENRTLAQQATHDVLTGLGNRAMFDQRLALAVEKSAQSGEAFAVLYLDANRFKQVNDRYGHDAGDVMLVVIAARLRVSMRRSDMAFRLGGDEFALILSPVCGREDADGVVNRITGHMAQPIMLPTGESIAASLSIGVALYPQDGANPRDLVRRADAAMYAAKHGRSQSSQEWTI
jgi:diguanylate cyclase (GGDEF)-like protein